MKLISYLTSHEKKLIIYILNFINLYSYYFYYIFFRVVECEIKYNQQDLLDT